MHLFFQSAIHFAVDVCHNVYHGHGIQAYIECIFLNFLTLCLASNDYFSLKLVASFVFVVALLWFQPVNAPIPTPREELVHFVISCVGSLRHLGWKYFRWNCNVYRSFCMATWRKQSVFQILYDSCELYPRCLLVSFWPNNFGLYCVPLKVLLKRN